MAPRELGVMALGAFGVVAPGELGIVIRREMRVRAAGELGFIAPRELGGVALAPSPALPPPGRLLPPPVPPAALPPDQGRPHLKLDAPQDQGALPTPKKLPHHGLTLAEGHKSKGVVALRRK